MGISNKIKVIAATINETMISEIKMTIRIKVDKVIHVIDSIDHTEGHSYQASHLFASLVLSMMIINFCSIDREV